MNFIIFLLSKYTLAKLLKNKIQVNKEFMNFHQYNVNFIKYNGHSMITI